MGCCNALPGGYYADLNEETFHNNSFAISGGFTGAKGLLRFAYTPVISSMSDAVGRRPVILLALLCTSFSFITYAITENFLAFQIVDAIFDMLMLLISSLFSSLISDVIGTDRARVVAQALILSVYESALAMSFLGDVLDARISYALASVAMILAVVIGYFTIQETAPNTKNIAVEEEEQQPESTNKSIVFNAKRSLHVLKKYRNIQLLCFVAIFNSTDQALYSGPVLIYAKNQLGFDKTDQSYFLASVGAVSVAFSLVLVFATKLLRKNKNILITGLIGNFFLSLAWAFLKTKTEALVSTVVLFLCYMALPAVSSLAAQTVEKGEIGAAMGCIATARVIANTIAPVTLGELFAVAENSEFPGWPFLIGAGCAVIALVFASFIKVTDDREKQDEEDTPDIGGIE